MNSRPRAGVALSVTKPQVRRVDTPWISGPLLLTGTQRASAVLFNSVLQSERRNGPRPQSEPTADKHTYTITHRCRETYCFNTNTDARAHQPYNIINTSTRCIYTVYIYTFHRRSTLRLLAPGPSQHWISRRFHLDRFLSFVQHLSALGPRGAFLQATMH